MVEAESETPIKDVFADYGQTWLGVTIGIGEAAGEEITPRQPIGSVPYAVRAGEADNASKVGNWSQNSLCYYSRLAAATGLCTAFGASGRAYKIPTHKTAEDVCDEHGRTCIKAVQLYIGDNFSLWNHASCGHNVGINQDWFACCSY